MFVCLLACLLVSNFDSEKSHARTPLKKSRILVREPSFPRLWYLIPRGADVFVYSVSIAEVTGISNSNRS